jgi:hypothetical protein
MRCGALETAIYGLVWIASEAPHVHAGLPSPFMSLPLVSDVIDYIINPVQKNYEFRWIEWNLAKIEKHGCDRREVERVVNNPVRGYPRRDGEKYLVYGRGQGNRWIRVVYLIDTDGTMFVIHAMPVSGRRRP